MVSADQLRSWLYRRRIPVYCVLGIALLSLLAVAIERRLSQWVLSELTEQASRMQIAISAEEMSLSLLRWEPRVSVDQLSIAAFSHEPVVEYSDVNVSLNWLDLFRKKLAIRNLTITNARLNLLVDDEGKNNWSPLFDALNANQNEDGFDFQLVRLDMPGIELEYINDKYDHSGLLEMQGQWFNNDSSVESEFVATGDINFLPVALEAKFDSVLSGNLIPQSGDFRLSGMLDSLTLKIDSIVKNTESFEDAQLAFSLEGQSLDKTLSQLNLAKSSLSSVSIQGSSHYNSKNILVGEINARLDESSANAEFSAEGLLENKENSGKKITGSLTADNLYLDSILGFEKVTGTNMPDDQRPDVDSRLFSSTPLLPNNPFKGIDLDLSVNVASLYSGRLHVNDMFMSITADNKSMSINLASDDVGKGRFSGVYAVNSSDDGLHGKLSAQVQRVPISDVISLLDLPDGVASGTLSGDASFWVTGKTEAELASSLDGGMFMLIEDGKLDSLIVEMAGIDLMESVSLVAKKDIQHSDIRCGYMDIQADKGQVVIKDFIVDTEDSVFLATGKLDLVEERVNIKFSPHPRDTSFFAATTPVHIVGSLTNPKIRPGKKLYTRLALAAAMAALVGPAAIVLPFVEMGDGGEKSYCSELFGK